MWIVQTIHDGRHYFVHNLIGIIQFVGLAYHLDHELEQNTKFIPQRTVTELCKLARKDSTIVVKELSQISSLLITSLLVVATGCGHRWTLTSSRDSYGVTTVIDIKNRYGQSE